MPVNRWRAGQARFPVRVPAVRGTGRGGRRADLGEAQNLSQGRVLLRLDKAMVPGVPVGVTLRLSPRPPLTPSGTVVSVQPLPNLPGQALGIRFSDRLPWGTVAEIADEQHPPCTPATTPLPTV